MENLTEYMILLQRRLGVPTQDAMAKLVGMAGRTYKERLRDIESMRLGELWRIEQVGKIAGYPMPEVRKYGNNL